MEQTRGSGTLGVVVVHEPDGPVAELPAIRCLVGQVDELLIVFNGGTPGDVNQSSDEGIRCISFPTNRGTAAAWNAALSAAAEHGHQFLYILDQDSRPFDGTVATALANLQTSGAAAVVQPTRTDRLRVDPFPWNAVASGSLYEVRAVRDVGGFDERLFVDEVDHELLARLLAAGHGVKQLATPTIDHEAGVPRPVAFLGRQATVSGHGAARRGLQGFSAGVLVRRYLRRSPGISARLLARHGLNAAKDLAAGQQRSARALVAGLARGFATRRPPLRAAFGSCPYCNGVLVGCYGAVPDWRFGTGPPGEVYRCATCGALAAGRVPGQEEISSWYSTYYTHSSAPAQTRGWAGLWPTPRRRRELVQLRSYFASPRTTGRFLEVGTGSGERLVEFVDAGWDVVGQDPDPKAGHLARARGLPIHHCPVDELVGCEAAFDLIGLNHVLEHAPNPREVLQACASLLAPGGRLCVISPNAQSLGRILFGRWWFGLEQPRHLAIPTLDSLTRLTAQLNLRAVRSESMATNGAVILGGSLDRAIQNRLPDGVLRRTSRSLTALLGQSMGRAAVHLNCRLGEEVIWIGQHADA